MIAPAHHRSSQRETVYGDNRSIMRLLIIEDDRDASDYLAKAFREVGHVAEVAKDGEE